MNREDLRNKIIPTTIENKGLHKETSEEFNTTDLIYLDSFEEQRKKNKC